MVKEDNKQDALEYVKEECAKLMDEERLKTWRGPAILTRLFHNDGGKYADLAVKYMSENPKILAKAQKIFLYMESYDEPIQKRLQEIADSDKAKSLFNVKELIKQAQSRSLEEKLADEQLSIVILNSLISRNYSEVMEVLQKDAQTEDRSIIKNVTGIFKDNLYGLYKSDYEKRNRLEKLQSVLDINEIFMQADAEYKSEDSLPNPQVVYKAYLDKKNDIRRILSSADLDFQLLDLCLDINEDATIALLRNDNKIRDNVKKLFGDCKTYMKQKKLAGFFEKNNMKEFGELVKQSAEKLKKLPGEEIFAIMDTNIVPAKHDLRPLNNVLDLYYKQTSELSRRAPESWLYYCHIGQSGYWDDYKLGLLDYVGKYKDVPILEELLEEKLGRTYAHYSYHENARFRSVRQEGVVKFEENLYKEIKKDINSPKAAFYLKFAKDVLSWNEYSYKYAEFASFMMENYFDKNPELCKGIIAELKNKYGYYVDDSKKKFKQDMIKSLKKDSYSPKSQFYVEQAANILFTQKIDESGLDKGEYRSFVSEAVNALKDKNPELCDKICKDAVPHLKDGDLVELYITYPSKELEESIKQYAEKLSESKQKINIIKLYEHILQIKLPAMEKALERILTSNKVVLDKKRDENVDYKPLIDKIRTLPIEKLSISSGANWVKELFPLSEILKLPDLKELRLELKTEEATEAYKILMHEKPENLQKLDISLSFEQSNDLMKKYPDLLIEGGQYDLYDRNETVIKAKSKADPLLYAINEEVWLEYLSVLPVKKQPTLQDFIKPEKNYFELIRKKADNLEKYQQAIIKAAEFINDQSVKDEIALWKAAKEHNIVEHLQQLPEDRRPTLEYMSKPLVTYGENTTMWDIIKKSYRKDKDEHSEVLGKILQLYKVDEKEIDKLSKLSNISDAITMWKAKQDIEKGEAAAQAAFKAWQESKGNRKE